MAKNLYKELREKNMEEYDKFPLYFAFGEKQFEDLVKRLNLSFEENQENYYAKKLVSVGYGGMCLIDDIYDYQEMVKRHSKSIEDAIRADNTGLGFIYDMFVCELKNHEYGYTGELDDTIDAIGLTDRDFEENPKLGIGLNEAIEYVMREEW